MDIKQTTPKQLAAAFIAAATSQLPDLSAKLGNPIVTKKTGQNGEEYELIEFTSAFPDAPAHKWCQIFIDPDEITAGTAIDHAHFSRWDFEDQVNTSAELSAKMAEAAIFWLKNLMEDRLLTILYFDKPSLFRRERLVQASTRVVQTSDELQRILASIPDNGPKRKSRAEAHLWSRKVFG